MDGTDGMPEYTINMSKVPCIDCGEYLQNCTCSESDIIHDPDHVCVPVNIDQKTGEVVCLGCGDFFMWGGKYTEEALAECREIMRERIEALPADARQANADWFDMVGRANRNLGGIKS